MLVASSMRSCVYPGALSRPPHTGNKTDFNQVRLVALGSNFDTGCVDVILPKSHCSPRVPADLLIDNTPNALGCFHLTSFASFECVCVISPAVFIQLFVNLQKKSPATLPRGSQGYPNVLTTSCVTHCDASCDLTQIHIEWRPSPLTPTPSLPTQKTARDGLITRTGDSSSSIARPNTWSSSTRCDAETHSRMVKTSTS